MITETVTVMEARDGYAWVSTERKSSCDSCGASKVCGTAVLDSVIGKKLSRLRVRNPVAAEPGQRVEIGIEDAVLIKRSLLVYMLPLLGLFFGAAVGQWLAGEGAAIAGGALGLAGGFLFARRQQRDKAQQNGYDAVILRTL